LKLALLAGLAGLLAAFAISVGAQPSANAATTYKLPPAAGSGVTPQWYWQIGGGNLPSMTSGAASSTNIWDTDDFSDAGSMGSNEEPNGASTVVSQLHAANKYSICYIEAGAQQDEPDASHFAAADYGSDSTQYQMQGYPGEYWFDTRGFAAYKYGDSNSVLTGAAANIAAGMAQRIAGCKAEGQDAIEPDDLDGYTNSSNSGAAGGGWGLTQQDAAGYEQWLAFTAHSDGLAVFQKNDGDNTATDEQYFDGMIIEECNHYNDPCGSGGDNTNLYIAAHKPVLNAEYTEDGESTAKFCSADESAGITGALFNVDLDGKTYQTCQTGAGYVYAAGGGVVTTTTSTTTPTTTTTTTTPTTTTTSTPTTTTTKTTPTTTTTTTAAPTGTKPVNTRHPGLSGTAKRGSQLTTSNGSWNGSPTKFVYSWKRCTAGNCTTVKNATHESYKLGSGDVGSQLESVVTASNTAGMASATSAASAVVTKKGRSSSIRMHSIRSRIS
jgi:Glycoside-hydrolase family GH114